MGHSRELENEKHALVRADRENRLGGMLVETKRLMGEVGYYLL